jgi:hypothetical protein
MLLSISVTEKCFGDAMPFTPPASQLTMSDSNTDGSQSGNIPILLLKTRSVPHDGYEEFFTQVKDGLGFEPTFVPVLEHKFDEGNLKVVKGFLEEKTIKREEGKKYGGMIFTSQRAVEAFGRLVEEGKGIFSLAISPWRTN